MHIPLPGLQCGVCVNLPRSKTAFRLYYYNVCLRCTAGFKFLWFNLYFGRELCYQRIVVSVCFTLSVRSLLGTVPPVSCLSHQSRLWLLIIQCLLISRQGKGERKFSVNRSNLASVLSMCIQCLNLGSEGFYLSQPLIVQAQGVSTRPSLQPRCFPVPFPQLLCSFTSAAR